MDAQAIETGVPAEVLMERAGRRCFAIAERLWPEACRFAVLCGIGNNGGDGFTGKTSLLKTLDEIRVLRNLLSPFFASQNVPFA